MKTHRIALIPGDGIGKEVVPKASSPRSGRPENRDRVRVDRVRLELRLPRGPRRMMPGTGSDPLGVRRDLPWRGGLPGGVPDHVSLWGLADPVPPRLRAVRQPSALSAHAGSPVAARNTEGREHRLRAIVRENIEGEYSAVGGRMFEGTDREIGVPGVGVHAPGRRPDPDLRVRARRRQRAAKHVTSATKSNGIAITMPYWDERFRLIAERYPGIRADQFHIDILAAHFVQRPERFDVVVGSNLFGDILSDLGPAVCGTIGIAPSANINPERAYPSLFEPVHGSAPDIAGRGIANPIGQIWSGALMLEHLGHRDASDRGCRRDRARARRSCGAADAGYRRQGHHGRRRQGDRGGDLTRHPWPRPVLDHGARARSSGLASRAASATGAP